MLSVSVFLCLNEVMIDPLSRQMEEGVRVCLRVCPSAPAVASPALWFFGRTTLNHQPHPRPRLHTQTRSFLSCTSACLVTRVRYPVHVCLYSIYTACYVFVCVFLCDREKVKRNPCWLSEPQIDWTTITAPIFSPCCVFGSTCVKHQDKLSQNVTFVLFVEDIFVGSTGRDTLGRVEKWAEKGLRGLDQWPPTRLCPCLSVGSCSCSQLSYGDDVNKQLQDSDHISNPPDGNTRGTGGNRRISRDN